MLQTFFCTLRFMNASEGVIKFKPLRPGQLMEFKPEEPLNRYTPHIIFPYVFQDNRKINAACIVCSLLFRPTNAQHIC